LHLQRVQQVVGGAQLCPRLRHEAVPDAGQARLQRRRRQRARVAAGAVCRLKGRQRRQPTRVRLFVSYQIASD